jgi:hypothetical protein
MYRGETKCGVEISGRVRDISHDQARQGGFGIGLATLEGAASSEELRGVAIQFDFGCQGYRTAMYPGDTHLSVVPAQLDNQWHDVRVRFDGEGLYSMEVDGVTKVSARGTRTCGNPTFRVSAGVAEFSGFAVRFL